MLRTAKSRNPAIIFQPIFSFIRSHAEFLLENPSIPGALDPEAEAERRRLRLGCPVCRAEVPYSASAGDEWIRAPRPRLEEQQEEFKVRNSEGNIEQYTPLNNTANRNSF